jgi:methylenetetrahydrofolate reductase (NADPH)
LARYKQAGIHNILALRGDPTGGPRASWTPTPGGLNHADELVSLAAEVGGFTIGVAAFPDGHPASGLNFDEDIEVLLRKEKAGASFATTQFFFDLDHYLSLVNDLADLGITKPVVPGIMPVTNIAQVERMAELSGAAFPAWLRERLESGTSPEDVRRIGVEAATELSAQLLEAGAPGLHFYTMNKSTATLEIYAQLGLPVV